MPLYEMACACGYVAETLRRYENRDDPKACRECGQPMKRLPSLTHAPPDGVYSYAPNLGNPNTFEQRHEAMKKQRSDTGRGVVLQDAQRKVRE